MNCLYFEEPADDSGYLHGWLDRNSNGWQASLAFYDMDEEPWYSPSCGKEPEYVGDIHVCLLSETAIETQIKFSRRGSCFVLDTAIFGPCMESCYVRCCLSDAWSVNGSCNVGCCFVLGMVQYRCC